MRFLPILILAFFTFASCNKKQMDALQSERDRYQNELTEAQNKIAELEEQLNAAQTNTQTTQSELQARLATAEAELAEARNRNQQLQTQLTQSRTTQSRLLEVLEDLSVVSPGGAENIQRSLQVLEQETRYLDNLAANLTRSLGPSATDDVDVDIVEGSVMISLSDQLLFPSGVADVQRGALETLSRVAQVINEQPQLEVVVQGHTDNVPIQTDCWQDNWDLSAQRASAVIRVLQWRYEVDPRRITLAASSQYAPKVLNDDRAGRRQNRRTEIRLMPTLDQLLQLVESPGGE